VPRNQLPCGNFTPVGVTGTPIIDGATRTLYVDGMILGAGGTPQHQVFALDADTGVVRPGWPVDLNATVRFATNGGVLTFDSRVQNQRGALALVGGRVFVPFGGHVGDCGSYHGWIVGITASNPTELSAWATRAIAGGIWGPAGIASDGASLYFTTGNTERVPGSFLAPLAWGDGEALFRLPPSLTSSGQTTDYFVPTNWADLDNTDNDLGGTGPILVDVPGATPSNLVVALGKDRRAYLVNRANMGAMSAPLAATTVSSNTIITAGAAYSTATSTYVVLRGGCLVAGQTGGLTAFRITATSPPTVVPSWCGGAATTGISGSPMVTMTNAQGADAIVWIVGNDNRLHGLNADTGQSVFAGGIVSDAVAGVQSFQTPIVVNGRIFLVGSQLYPFTIN
jgi:hypothetical protein